MMYGEHAGTLVDARHDQQSQSDTTTQTHSLTDCVQNNATLQLCMEEAKPGHQIRVWC